MRPRLYHASRVGSCSSIGTCYPSESFASTGLDAGLGVGYGRWRAGLSCDDPCRGPVLCSGLAPDDDLDIAVERVRNRKSLLKEKPSSLPRINADTFGWSIARSLAACRWVSFCSAMISHIRAARSALAKASSGSGTPMSANTLPVDSLISISSLMVSLAQYATSGITCQGRTVHQPYLSATSFAISAHFQSRCGSLRTVLMSFMMISTTQPSVRSSTSVRFLRAWSGL